MLIKLTHELAEAVRKQAAAGEVLSHWKHNKYQEQGVLLLHEGNYFLVNEHGTVRHTFVTHLEKRWTRVK